MFYNIDDAINWVVRQTKFREKTDLSIMKEAFEMLNINLDEIKKIHLAGTNGKGSTGAFLSEILVSNNYKVGWFTSPYLVKFNERVKINNLDINDNDLLKYINYFYDFNEALYLKNNVKLSFFEILTLLSFKYFKDNNVDVMLIEVGIGGRLDATNIIDYDVSIITSIGFDHMQQLGDTLESIAYEKVAILKKHGYLITNVNENLKKLMINYSKDLNATIKFIDNDAIKVINNYEFKYLNQDYIINLLGDYQRSNAVLAIEAAKYLFNLSYDAIKIGLSRANWPGRLEEIFDNVYIDGAHNEPAIEALVRNIKVLFKDKKITILFSALKGKDVSKMLNLFNDVSNKIILTSFDDLRFESLKEYETNNIKYLENGFLQLQKLINKQEPNEIIIATGSLHFIGYLKQEYNKTK